MTLSLRVFSVLVVAQVALSLTIVEQAIATPQLSTLVSVLTTKGYKPVLDALSGKGPFTVFAPTNEAFAAAGIDIKNVAAVTEVLKYHVLGAKVPSSALKASQEPQTLQGSTVLVTKNRQGVMVNKAKVVVADVMASNGVVHLIDRVLMLPKPAKDEPTKKPKTNTPKGNNKKMKSIVQTAQATKNLSTLLSVLVMKQFSPILDALSGDGPFTVFAPSNQAFTDAGVDVTDTATIIEVLKYHVLAGRVMAKDLKASQEVETLQGSAILVTANKKDGVMVNEEAKVIKADIKATNGIIHIINKVLMPPLGSGESSEP